MMRMHTFTQGCGGHNHYYPVRGGHTCVSVCVCVCVCVRVRGHENELFERTRHFHGLLNC